MNANEIFKNTPYTLSDIFNQICQYKCYEVNLKRTLLMNQSITQKVCLINAYWFERWKKISCYEAIKDELNMNRNIQENYQEHIKDYLCVVQKLNNTEILTQEINNSEIIGDFDEMLGRDNIDEDTEFELINRELWNSFYPQNNNETLIELDVKYLTNEQDSVYIDLSNNSCYILYWSRDKQKIVKLILIFDNIASKLNFYQIVKNIGFGNYYAGNLKEKIEKTDKEKIYDGNLTFDCINKNKRKLLPYEEYKKTKSPVGLNNIRQTCYMNAALQSLFNIPKLTNYLINNKNAINKLNVPLLEAYLKTILNLSRKAKKSKTITSYSPQDFHNIIVTENQFMDGASDSIDLVRYFLENMNRQLHTISLSEPSSFEKYFYNINNMNNGNNFFLQQVQALNTFINTYASANKSIILNTFYYIEKSQIQCCNCNCITSNFNSQMEIVFPLEEVRKYVNENNISNIINKYNQMCNINNNSFNGMNNVMANNLMNQMMMEVMQMINMNPMNSQVLMMQIKLMSQLNIKINLKLQILQIIKTNIMMATQCLSEIMPVSNNKNITLDNCFDYYNNKKTFFEGNNRMQCKNCRQLSNAFQFNTLYSLPDYLIINLNRGKGNMYDVGISFNEEIDLNNLVETKIDNNHYKLICIVTHLGPSGPSGHYISFCYKYNYKRWFIFDDSLVYESSFKEASTCGQTYILFYERQQMIQNNN